MVHHSEEVLATDDARENALVVTKGDGCQLAGEGDGPPGWTTMFLQVDIYDNSCTYQADGQLRCILVATRPRTARYPRDEVEQFLGLGRPILTEISRFRSLFECLLGRVYLGDRFREV